MLHEELHSRSAKQKPKWLHLMQYSSDGAQKISFVKTYSSERQGCLQRLVFIDRKIQAEWKTVDIIDPRIDLNVDLNITLAFSCWKLSLSVCFSSNAKLSGRLPANTKISWKTEYLYSIDQHEFFWGWSWSRCSFVFFGEFDVSNQFWRLKKSNVVY